MNPIHGEKVYKLAGLVMLLGLSVLLIACSRGVSAEDFDAVEEELKTTQTQVQDLQSDVVTMSQDAESRV